MSEYKLRMNALYNNPCLPDFEGNPFIEALPPLLEPAEIYKKLYSPIPYEDSERQLSKSQRVMLLWRLKELFIPNSKHIELYNMIYRSIVGGYKDKNPFNPENVRRRCNIRRKYFNIDVDISQFYIDSDMDVNLYTTSSGLCIFGISGGGKTVSVQRVLSLLPQFIRHTEYKNRPLIENQVVYVKLECPTDGTIKTLCNSFFNSLDGIVDNAQYFKNWGGERRGTMVQNMPNIALNENIGLIVIDEIQHLVRTEYKTKELLDFLVEIINTIQVPILMIGTNKAFKVLQNNIRGPRRIGGDGFILWDRITDKEEWKIFMNALWRYQWTKEKVSLTDRLIDTFYEHSQGIMDFAIKLFMFTQANAIYSGYEKIDEEIINNTAKKDLILTEKMRMAIQSGNVPAMSAYEDIVLPNENERLRDLSKRLDAEERVKEIAALDKIIIQQNKEQLYTELLNKMQKLATGELNLLKEALEEVLKNIDISKSSLEIEQDVQSLFMLKFRDKLLNEAESRKPKVVKKIISFNKKDLRSALIKSEKENKDVYMTLYEKGYIKSPIEFIS